MLADGGVPPPSRLSGGALASPDNRFNDKYNVRMTTAYTFVPSLGHIYSDHPEAPSRFDVLEPRLNSFAAEALESKPARREDVARVHHPELISAMEQICRRGPAVIDAAPTYVTQTSFDDALLAAGGTLACTRTVLSGEVQNAFALIRPPGHHAEPDRAMGFCIFNNIAIAARDALENGLKRVAIVDYDAHHGNGTQAAFLDEPRVGYLSTHQWGIYPGTGWYEEAPHARGRIVNMPLLAYAGDQTFELIADQIIHPFLDNFKPELILVSVGFDAHWSDPITTLGLSSAGYFMLARKMVELGEEFCDGKVVFVLEGGYDPANVANGAAGVFAALGKKEYANPGDASPQEEPDFATKIAEIRNWQGF